MIKHSKEYGVYHWDTFERDPECSTILLDEFDKLDDARDYVAKEYKGRISGGGADKVEIVDSKGEVIDQYPVK